MQHLTSFARALPLAARASIAVPALSSRPFVRALSSCSFRSVDSRTPTTPSRLPHRPTCALPLFSACAPSVLGRYASSTSATESSNEKPGYVVLSMVGKDKVGIVKDFSHYLTSLGANVEESRMSLLGGDFAIIVLVSLRGMPADQGLAKFKAGLAEKFPDFLIHARLTEGGEELPVEQSSQGGEEELVAFEIQVDGPDSPGIVAAVTTVLAARNITVTNLETETTAAAFAGYPLFRMDLECRMTLSQATEVERELETVEERFGVAVSVFELEEEVLEEGESEST
ncbi:hypothetical protein HDU93_007165 [Gonapodya sp. JEL0774]|nr:hypothetical protein HDU93_007165 [Gonapodya sp. JEL0774]